MERGLIREDRAVAAAEWDAPVRDARFVDAARAAALERLGISAVGDLLRHTPSRYLDLSSVRRMAQLRPGEEATVVGRVHEIREKRPRPRLNITEVAIVDGTGVVLGVWFNQPWVAQRFVVGEHVAFAGKVELDYGLKRIKVPFVEKLGAEEEPGRAGRVLAVHPTTEGLTTNWLRRLVAAAVEDYADVPDHLPSSLRSERGLMSLAAATRAIHFPLSVDEAAQARRRLAYDELLLLQCYMALRRHAITREQAGVAHSTNGAALGHLKGNLPFALTSDQVTAIGEVLSDMASPHAMNRMLLGDVGTGKTVVAAHALCAAADSGGQAAMMAPTEVLAQQYVRALGPLLDASGVPWALLTGSTPVAQRREVADGLESGAIKVVFGTHALLEEHVRFSHLTLSVVDEQHRFGVSQRLGLRGKGAAADLLVMTATPIPRSLALTLYGDLDVSYLREKPHGKGPGHVKTELIRPQRADKAYELIRAQVRAGHQAYVVCALVDESDAAQAKAATSEVEHLRRQVFPDLRVGLLTGRMRPAEKAEAMANFRDGKIDVLVSTTVIEVGVDVPNATVMVVQDADRFGLAQLHQLRGRVGRGEHPGMFVLLTEARSEESRARMDALLETDDGFELAEVDLRLRGEGHILGDRQHGLPALRLASVLEDQELIALSRADAVRLIEEDPHLTRPEHAPLLRAVRRAFADAWEWVSSG
jgi:ATP-dependent DNA helicase RecG